MNNKGFIIKFSEGSSRIKNEEYKEYLYWHIDNTVLPNTKAPLTSERAEELSKVKKISIIENVDEVWGDTEFDIYDTFRLLQPILTIEEEEEETEKESIKEPVREVIKEPVKEVIKEPVKEVIKEPVKEVIKEPVVIVEEPAKEDVMREASVPSVLMSPDYISGTASNQKEPEKVLFEQIMNQFKRLRNRKLKISVLIGDLQDCQSQGFAVEAAYHPLQSQIDSIEEFETGICDDLSKIITKMQSI